MSAASQQESGPASQRSVRTRHYRDLIAWQKAMALSRQVYLLTENMPPDERFGLTSQMRRSAVSVPSNIAEGHGRLTDRSLRAFLGIARGSLYELETQILLAADLQFLKRDAADTACNRPLRSRASCMGLLRTLEAQV